jgi:HSP20 family protein
MTFLTKFEPFDPFEEMTLLRDRMDHLWSHMTVEGEKPLAVAWSPTADIIETKDETVIQAELPGIDDDNLQVSVDDGLLTIKGVRNAEKETEEKGFRRIERPYGTFLRSFTVPPNIQAEKITAIFANGLLEVHLPKKEETKPLSIKVNVKKQLVNAA